jgi:superfamily I DNA/RNA helicase
VTTASDDQRPPAPAERRIAPDAWDEPIAIVTGPQLVVAGPGTGKTEFLVRRALHLIDDGVRPDELLLLSFSRRGADDLRRRVEDRLTRSFTALAASTFHSLAYRLIERFDSDVADTPALLTSPEQVALVHEMLGEEDPGAWPLPFRGLLRTHTLAAEVADFVLRCSELLIDADRLEARVAERAEWRAMPGFLRRYRATLDRIDRIDYGTVQARAVELLSEPEVADSVAAQHRYLLVDEYQDTTTAQAELLRRLYRPHHNLTVAGDPYQSIYSFRGTELGNIAAFPETFPDAAGAPATRWVLTASFRVPAAILDAAVRITAGGELPGAAGPVEPAPGTGAVDTYGFDQASHEAAWIAAEIQRLHLTDGIPYRGMAVLVRSKRRFLAELSRALDRHRIPHDRPDARLIDHRAVRLVFDCVLAAIEPGDLADRAVERILLGPLFALPLGSFRALQRERVGAGHSWAEALAARTDAVAALAPLLEDSAWAVDRPAADGFWWLWTRLPGLPELVASPNATDDLAAWSSFSQVLNRLRERSPGLSLADYLRLSEDEDFEATPLLGFRRADADRLTLTTLHQAKGLEFDVVFIADAVEGVFPDLRRRDSLLATSRLATTRPAEPGAYVHFRLQEEMRLAYTAMCRARRRVVWTATSSGIELGEGAPSRFLPLVAGVDSDAAATRPPPPHGSVVTPLDAEAWLRRRLRDPAAAPPVRLAAVAALTAAEDWGLRSVDSFSGVRRRGPNAGLVHGRLRLSPSQVARYLDCPRRYAFERRLHVGDATSVHAAFGTLIHDVLEAAEGAAVERGDDHATRDDALAALTERWDPTEFGAGAFAAAWRARAVDTLGRLYDAWPSSGKAVLLEHELRLDRHGADWIGRADRIEQVGDELRVVDYKTSRTAATIGEAAGSIQLGFYVLAANHDTAVTNQGPVTGAEFWYPSKVTASVTTRRFDPDLLGLVDEQLSEAADGIAQEDWAARPGNGCRHCAVRIVCPAWPEGREAYRS